MAIAIGDIHGCLHPLINLLGKLPPDEELVFLGDYVDRGPNSAQVVDYLLKLSNQRSCHFVKGNHEAMLDAATRDESVIASWLMNGGIATLRSYGTEAKDWLKAPERRSHFKNFWEFFDNLLPYHEDEHAIYVHAGIDVDISQMENQDPSVLMWVRDAFIKRAAEWEGKQVIFGHTPTQGLSMDPGSIYRSANIVGIDTGCVFGGFLTAYDTLTQKVYQVPQEFRTHSNSVGIASSL